MPPGIGAAEYEVQYEVLRTAALGAALPLKARSGLMLFLRRGMWGWAKALSATVRPQQEQGCQPAPTPSLLHASNSAVVHVLAAIAIGIHDRRPA
ncbi:MAG: hypothetical protein V2I82_13830 [Halieaceae bacterium]|nr:hypothetical protein [Halieaceae bacterium]